MIIQNFHLKIARHSENAEQINETFIDVAEHINITVPMYNLTEYSDIIFPILQEVYGSLGEMK